MSSKRVSFTIGGKVQGVNFRSYTRKQASNMGVTGYVTNASDGSVQGEAQGNADQIQEFVQHLHKGPSAASVKSVHIVDIAAKSDESSFSIK